jgi:hypothetical protein
MADSDQPRGARILAWLGAGLGVVSTLAFFGAAISAKGLFSSEVASWAQAIGAVAAIAVTARLAFLPIEAEHRQHRTTKIELINAISDAVDYALVGFDPIAVAIDAQDAVALKQARTEWSQDAPASALHEILALPIAAWPTPVFFARVMALREALNRAVEASDPGMSFGSTVQWPAAQQRLAVLRRQRVAYQQSLDGLVVN